LELEPKMDILTTALTLIGVGALSTYAVANAIPEEILACSSEGGRFTGLGGQNIKAEDFRSERVPAGFVSQSH
jgi:hypothetical protein